MSLVALDLTNWLLPLLSTALCVAVFVFMRSRLTALRDEGHQAPDLFQSLPQPAICVDERKRVIAVNAAFENRKAIESGAWREQTLDTIFPTKVSAEIEENLSQFLAGSEQHYEFEVTSPDKECGNARVTLVASPSATGQRTIWLIFTDISEIALEKQRVNDFTGISSNWFWETDVDDRFVYFAGAPDFQSGFTNEERIGKTRRELADNYTDSLTNRRFREGIERIEKIVERRTPIENVRYWVTGADGQPRYVSVNGKPFYDPDGNFAGYRGCTSDLTEEKHAQEAHDEYRNMYQRLVDLSPDAIVLQTTENGKIAFANHSAAKLLGLSDSKDLIGRDFLDFMNPDDRENARERNRITLETGRSLPVTTGRFVRVDGYEFHVERSVTPCVYQGKPAFISMVRDITERRLIMKNMEEARARQAAILKIAPTAIIAVSEDGQIEEFNGGAEEIFGYSAEEMLGENIRRLIPERFREAHEHHIREAAKASGDR